MISSIKRRLFFQLNINTSLLQMERKAKKMIQTRKAQEQQDYQINKKPQFPLRQTGLPQVTFIR